MRTELVEGSHVTTLRPQSRAKLLQIIEKFTAHTSVPKIGRWKSISSEELWSALVSQVCVMGSARGMESLDARGERAAFEKATSLRAWARHGYREVHLAQVVGEFGASRFPNKSAATLRRMAESKSVVRGGKVVLLDGLESRWPTDQSREWLMARCELFGRKSASDFMITTGISHDVIALDQRVVGVFNEHLEYSQKFSHVQANKGVYLSVEACLRDVCKEAGISLGKLDRLLFKFAGMSAFGYLCTIEPR